MVIGSLVTNIVADLSKWGPNLTKARGQMAKFTKSVNAFQAVIGGAVVGSIGSWMQATVDQASALQDASQKLNVGVEALQKYRHAAEQLGSSSNTLDRSLLFLNKTIGKAMLGSEGAAKALADVGLSADELAGDDKALLKVVDALGQLPNRFQQSAAATALFGKAGQDMLLVVDAGSEGLAKIGDELQRIGGVAGASAVAKLDTVGEKIAELQKVGQATSTDLLGVLAPVAEFKIGQVKRDVGALKAVVDGLKQTYAEFKRDLAPDVRGSSRGGGASGSFDVVPIGVNQPRNPAMTGSPNWYGESITNNQKQFMQGLTSVMNMLPGRIQLAIAQAQGKSLPAPVDNFLQGIGRVIGGGMGGMATAGAKMLGQVPGFAMTRSGSAESYRQQVRIERNSPQMQIANKQLDAQKRTATAVEKLVGMVKGGGEMLAANFTGGG